MVKRKIITGIVVGLAILFLPIHILGIVAVLMAAFWPRSVVPGLPGLRGRVLLGIIGALLLAIRAVNAGFLTVIR